jgi:hypothetical protein
VDRSSLSAFLLGQTPLKLADLQRVDLGVLGA